MKRLLYICPILIASCGQTSNQDQQSTTVDSTTIKANSTIQNIDSIEAREESTELDSLNSLEIFKDFALNFSPTRKPNSGVAMLPETSDSVLSAIRILKTLQPKEFEKYLTLIFIKLYSAHLECCHQSYEIRKQPPDGIDKEKDPLVYEFNILTRKFPDNKLVESITSNIGYGYVKSHKYLLDFEPIKKHVEIIEQVHKNAKDGVYWK